MFEFLLYSFLRSTFLQCTQYHHRHVIAILMQPVYLILSSFFSFCRVKDLLGISIFIFYSIPSTKILTNDFSFLKQIYKEIRSMRR